MIYGLYTAIGLAALALMVATVVSVLRNPRVPGGEKALWIVLAVVFPFFGSLVYFTVRRSW